MICSRRLRRGAFLLATGVALTGSQLGARPLGGPQFAVQSEPLTVAEPLTVGDAAVCEADDPRGLPSAETIQACIDRAAAYSIVEIPPGRYAIHHQIVIGNSITLRTAGTGPSSSCVSMPDACAVFVAAPDFLDQWGLLAVRSTTKVRIEHLVIDGNRAARDASEAARHCLDGENIYGFNASALECDECGLEDVVSRNALCGTGMAWTGAQATIEHSAFLANGDAATPRMWSDGLTLLSASRAVIRENTFEDNSDVALIIGQGVDSRVERNAIVQRRQPAFAGLMLDNFNSNDRSIHGDFHGAVVANNTVDCGVQLCTFGIQAGPRPWYPTNNIVGGELHDNAVKGAKIGINVDGAGEVDSPTAIFDNVVDPAPQRSYFSKCAQPIPAEWMNIAPTSFVDRRGEETKVGFHLSDMCQLFSRLSND